MLHLRFLNHNNTNTVVAGEEGGYCRTDEAAVRRSRNTRKSPRATTAVILHYNMGVVPVPTLYFKRRSTIQDVVVNI